MNVPPGPPWERREAPRRQPRGNPWARLVIDVLSGLGATRVVETQTIEVKVPAFSDFTTEERAWCGQLIEAGYRALARKNHPDRGGSTDKMQALNAVVTKLRAALEISE